jgi:hypothetical protein
MGGASPKIFQHGGTETWRKTKSKAKAEHTEVAENTEAYLGKLKHAPHPTWDML